MDADIMDKLISCSNLLSSQIDNLKNEVDKDKFIQEYLKTTKIPPICDFPKNAEWFNVSKQLAISSLEGKVVVLDFFTYCCINCMHVLPDLKALEEEFSVEDGLVVVGVHSAKFENEKQSENILAAVQRYNISHPVVNDANAEFWNNLNICCWPTLLILGPSANPLFILMGERHKDELFSFVRNALNFYKDQNKLNFGSLPLMSANCLLPKTRGPLLFPGKVTCLRDRKNGDMLAVSDTGNNRILISKDNGEVSYVIGGNGPGFKDGDFETALFNGPQGLVFHNENILYVADTENHVIRKVDLLQGQVQTVAGTGQQGIDHSGGKKGTEQEISSPWDVCIFSTPDLDMSFHGPNDPVTSKDILLIAMAGTHQIWALFLDDIIWWKFKRYSAGTCLAIAGSGREENRNNLYPHAAAFAQPSGIALDEQNKDLYIADSESSSIRRLSLLDGKVTAVVGGNRSPTNLFDFGDIDGKQYEAKLQHPLGIASSSSGFVYVADSYNHKIKKIDSASNTICSLYGTGKQGDNNSAVKGPIQFNEPGGLCVSSNSKLLYVADTNNHAIKIIELAKKQTSSKINFILPDNSLKVHSKCKDALKVSANGGECLLNLKFDFDNSVKLAASAPNKVVVKAPKDFTVDQAEFANPVTLKVKVPKLPDGNESSLILKVNLVICKHSTCIPLSTNLMLQIVSQKNGASSLSKYFQFAVNSQNISLK